MGNWSSGLTPAPGSLRRENSQHVDVGYFAAHGHVRWGRAPPVP
jgi:hypothetical protein